MLHGHSYKDGVLQGVVITPGTHETLDIKYVGSPMDLMKVAMFLGLEPVEGQVEEMQQGKSDGTITLSDERGGFATLSPVERASDLLHTIAAEFARRVGEGELPPDMPNPFL